MPDAPPLANANGIPPFAARRAAAFGGRISAGWRSTQPWVRMLVAAQVAGLAVLGTILTVDTRRAQLSDPRRHTARAGGATRSP
jgi:hypothetical protein